MQSGISDNRVMCTCSVRVDSPLSSVPAVCDLQVGYGDSDLLPISGGEKMWTIAFMLFSTTALVTCVERLKVISTSRRIYLKDFKAELPHLMRKEAIRERRANPTLVEDEFVLHVLQEYGVVDADLLHHIRNDFKKIESFGIANTNDLEIEVRTLFDRMVARGNVLDSNRVAPQSTYVERNERRRHLDRETDIRGSSGEARARQPPDAVVDMSVSDNGFAEWYDDVWKPFLERDHGYATRTALAIREQRAKGERQKTRIAGARDSLRTMSTFKVRPTSTFEKDGVGESKSGFPRFIRSSSRSGGKSTGRRRGQAQCQAARAVTGAEAWSTDGHASLAEGVCV